MTPPRCPVCDTPVATGETETVECTGCDATLERGEGGAWVLAGDAPAG